MARMAACYGTYVDGLDLLLRQNIKCTCAVSKAVHAPNCICAGASLEDNVHEPLHLLRSAHSRCAAFNRNISRDNKLQLYHHLNNRQDSK